MTNLTTILAITALTPPLKITLTILGILVIIAIVMILSKLVKNYLEALDANEQSTLSSTDSTDMRTELEKEVNSNWDNPPKVIMEHKSNSVDFEKAEEKVKATFAANTEVESTQTFEANDLETNKGLQAIEESPIEISVLQTIKEKFLANRTRNQVKDYIIYNFNKTESEAEQLVKKALKRYDMAYDHEGHRYDFKANIAARRIPNN